MPRFPFSGHRFSSEGARVLRAGEDPVEISKELLDILVCPLSRAPLVLEGNFLVSTDPQTRRRYRIEHGFPVMLIDDSEELDEASWKAIMEKHYRGESM